MTIRPWWTSIAGSIRLLRNPRRRDKVRSLSPQAVADDVDGEDYGEAAGGGHCSGTTALRRPSRMGSSGHAQRRGSRGRLLILPRFFAGEGDRPEGGGGGQRQSDQERPRKPSPTPGAFAAICRRRKRDCRADCASARRDAGLSPPASDRTHHARFLLRERSARGRDPLHRAAARSPSPASQGRIRHGGGGSRS